MSRHWCDAQLAGIIAVQVNCIRTAIAEDLPSLQRIAAAEGYYGLEASMRSALKCLNLRMDCFRDCQELSTLNI